VNLVELDLSGNMLCGISGLDALKNLQKLVLKGNRISAVDGLKSLSKLEHLLLQGNKISTMSDLNLQQIASIPHLTTLYLRNVDGGEVREPRVSSLIRRNPNRLGCGRVHYKMLLQACPVCRLSGYKEAVLAALPRLKNLDGERNPRRSSYFIIVDQVTQVQKELEHFRHDFSFTDPKPWITAEALVPEPVPHNADADSIKRKQDHFVTRLEALVDEINAMSILLRARA
jgi:Leucine-rich repeat (LRR) protein